MSHFKPTELPAHRGAEGDISRRQLLLLSRHLQRMEDRVRELEERVEVLESTP